MLQSMAVYSAPHECLVVHYLDLPNPFLSSVLSGGKAKQPTERSSRKRSRLHCLKQTVE